MEAEARAIERDRFDAERFRPLCDALADDRRGAACAAVLQLLAHVGFRRRCAREHLVARWRDELCINVRVRAAHGKPRRALLGDAKPRLARAAESSFLLRLHPRIPTSFSFP